MTLADSSSHDSSADRSNIEILLDGIAIENYRSFDKFPAPFSKNDLQGYLELGRLTTIIGRNDVGKSNLLHAIMLVLDDEKASPTDFHKGNVDNNIIIYARFLITGDSDDVEKYREKLQGYGIYVDDSNHFHLQLRASYNHRTNRVNISWYTYRRATSMYGGLEEQGIRRNIINELINNVFPRPLYIPSFIVPSNEVSLKKGSRFSELISPLIEQSTLQINGREKSLQELLKHRVEKVVSSLSGKIARYLKSVWSDIEDVKITVSRVKLSQALEIDVKLTDKYVGEISLSKRGSGLQREFLVELLRVYRDLNIGKGYILLIEEPEVFLHAEAQRKFMSILRDISRNSQVIITTHSSIFIDRSDLRYIYLFKKENGRTVSAWLSNNDVRIDEIVEELGINPSDILLANGVIFVEGIIDVEVLTEFARAIIPNWDELNIVIMNGGGKDNILHFSDYPNELKKVNKNIAIILDADIKTENPDKPEQKRMRFKNNMEKHGIPVYFWKKDNTYVRELENLFDLDSINEIIEESIRKSGKTCSNYLIKAEELTPYTEVFELYKKKLRECGLEAMGKRKFSKRVAKRMIEKGKIPKEIEEILLEILKNFNIT